MGALYAWCCMCYADASLTPSRCGWRIVVETASEMINSAKITQKVSILLPLKRRTKNAKTFHDKCENFTFRASNETAAFTAVFLFIKWDHFGYG